MKPYVHNEIILSAADNGRLLISGTDGNSDIPDDKIAPFELRVFGGERAKLTPEDCLFEGAEEHNGTVTFNYNCIKHSLKVIHHKNKDKPVATVEFCWI